MAFDPDAYLGGGSPGFDPDKYLGEFNPDAYLAEQPAGVTTTAKTTGYHPVSPDSPDYKMEGGNVDKMGKPIFTLDQFRRGEAPFVTIAGDPAIPYGTPATSPHFPGVPFMVNDTGSAFKGAGLSHFDIARDTAAGANSDENNRQVQFDLANPNFALPQQQDQPQAALPQEAEAAQPDITAQQILGQPEQPVQSVGAMASLSPPWFRNAVEALKETGSELVPHSVPELAQFLTPVASLPAEAKKTYGMVHDLIEGVPIADAEQKNFPESQLIADAQKTPPLSQERFHAGFSTLAKFGLLAAGAKGLTSGQHTTNDFIAKSSTEGGVVNEQGRIEVPNQGAGGSPESAQGSARQAGQGLAGGEADQGPFAGGSRSDREAQQGSRGSTPPDRRSAGYPSGAEPAGRLPTNRGSATPADQLAGGQSALTPQGPLTFQPFAELPQLQNILERPPLSGLVAAFRDKTTGKVFYGRPGRGHISMSQELPRGNPQNLESGFAGPDGKFLTADEAHQFAAKEGIIGGSRTTREGKKVLDALGYAERKYPNTPTGFAKAEAASADFGFAEKVKRVASETGANKPQSVHFRGGAEFRKYFQEWGDRLKGLVKFARTVKRYTDTREVRDTIAATYDAIDNKAGYAAKQAGSNVRLNLPSQSELADKAATFVRQAEGDRAGMTNKLQAIRGRGFDDVIDYALRNWEKLEPAADAAKKQTDTLYDAELAAGIDFGYRQGYVKGVYEDDLKVDLKPLDKPNTGGGGTTAHTKSKVFNDYAEAIAAGFKPRDLRLSTLTESSVRNGMRLVNNQAWTESLGTMVLPDGKPAMVPMEMVEARDSAGNIKQRQSTPEGYTPVQVSPGNLVAVHEDAAGVVHALSAPSQFPAILSKGSAAVKHNMLAFDIYHGSRFAQMQMAFEGLLKPSYHKGLAVLEYSDGDLGRAVKDGEISQKEADWAKAKRPILEAGIKAGLNSGKISDALFRQTAPLFPYAKATSEFIFGKLSRGVISQSYVYAFERNGRIHPEWSSEKLHSYTAREVNTYYRNMGSQGLFKSKTWQDGARFLTFAPQWFEGKARSEGRGYGQTAKALINPTKGGNVAKGMGTGLVAYFAVNQMVNMLTRGYPTWDNPEHGHKFDAWIADFSGGSNGFFHSPLGVFAEISHDAIKAHERGTDAMSIPLEIGKSQLGIGYAVGRDLFGGVDFYGRPLEGFDRFKQAAIDAAPVPITIKNRGYAGAGQRNLFSFAGLKITPAGTKSSNVYQMANDFMRKNDIKVERGASVYSPLRQALAEGRTADAQAAYQDLLKQGPVWESLAKKKLKIHEAMIPDKFTNSNETESRFRKQLTRDQLDIYNAALVEKRKIWNQYQALPKN